MRLFLNRLKEKSFVSETGQETVHYFCNDILFVHIDGHGCNSGPGYRYFPHPDLKGRIVAAGDMLYGKKRMYDDNSHGTYVAGITGSEDYLRTLCGRCACLPDHVSSAGSKRRRENPVFSLRHQSDLKRG